MKTNRPIQRSHWLRSQFVFARIDCECFDGNSKNRTREWNVRVSISEGDTPTFWFDSIIIFDSIWFDKHSTRNQRRGEWPGRARLNEARLDRIRRLKWSFQSYKSPIYRINVEFRHARPTLIMKSRALKLGELHLKNFNFVILNLLPGTNRLINCFWGQLRKILTLVVKNCPRKLGQIFKNFG